MAEGPTRAGNWPGGAQTGRRTCMWDCGWAGAASNALEGPPKGRGILLSTPSRPPPLPFAAPSRPAASPAALPLLLARSYAASMF